MRGAKASLVNYEAQDMGKPVDEGEWDMVSGGGAERGRGGRDVTQGALAVMACDWRQRQSLQQQPVTGCEAAPGG